MSIPRRQTVQCPKCGADIEFTYWQSINTQMPNAIPDIISGKLFDVECKKCGNKTFVNYPMLFNDMIHNVMIYYTMPDDVEETEKIMARTSKLLSCRNRIVTDQLTLREKAAIFNAELDDRVIEVLKLIILLQVKEQLAGREIMATYFHPGEEPVFEIVTDGDSGFVPVTMEMYEKVAEEFCNPLPEDDEYIIDQDWAQEFISAWEEEQE